MKALLDEAATKAGSNAGMQQIGDFFASGMDSVGIEKRGFDPIKKDLARVDAITDMNGYLNDLAYFRTQGIGGLFGFFIAQDRKVATQYIPQLSQGGTTLPDRDYYLKNDARSTTVRNAYKDHLAKMFRLIGDNDEASAQHADAILRIETALAKAQMARVEMRDPYKTYNKFAVKDFTATTPSLNWNDLLSKLEISNADSLVVNNPSFFKTADVLLTALPLNDWKTYMKWNILKDAAPYLSNAFVKQDFAFQQVLSGQKEQTPRWQRMSSLIDNQMGDLLGQLYVQKYFSAEARQRLQELVSNLQQVFAARIKMLDWMSDDTKVKALEKLEAFTKKLGYPDKWKDYSSVQIDKNDLYGNVVRTDKWSYEDMIKLYGKPVDKTRWGMTPPTINAYYNPTNNEIVFPAGILQFPFFDPEADDAINYGGIGAVIGHEMTHGFDDQGRQFAADGNLKDWWTKDDADKFRKRADEVVSQYNGFTVLDTLHVNGRLTLGENLADLGGLSMAYEAFTHTKQFQEGRKVDGFTPAQRFFLNWAQVWRNNTLPETQSQLILTDPHSPGMYRANGPLSNIDAWYEAFNVQPGNKMYKAKDQRTRIW